MGIDIELDTPKNLKWTGSGDLNDVAPSLERATSRTTEAADAQAKPDIWAWTTLISA